MSTIRLVSDTEIASILGVSKSFVRKDRAGRQILPFYRIGDRCLYNPPEALDALQAVRQGGEASRSAARRVVQSRGQMPARPPMPEITHPPQRRGGRATRQLSDTGEGEGDDDQLVAAQFVTERQAQQV
jgi:hypothetical protein